MSASRARDLLGVLLDRIERRPDRSHPPSQVAPADFGSADDRDAFARVLGDAARNGSVAIVRGRGEARHLIDRVRLLDAKALYAFLGRTPLEELAAERVARFRAGAISHSQEAGQAIEAITAGWLRGGRPFGLAGDQIPRAREFIRAVDAVVARDPMDRRDLRTYSGQVTRDTKLLERHATRIVALFKSIGRVDPALSDADAMASLGLEKFPQPVLVSGPVRVGAIDFGELVYVGLPPEQAPLFEAAGPISSVLTIENLASFNRYVREVRQRDEVVVYTGGFPSRAAAATILSISRWPCVQVIHHWGDIDEGGVRIALYLCSIADRPIVPHLMSPEAARRLGTPARPIKLAALKADHPWRSLVEFLQSEDAAHLEQERMDPEAVTKDAKD